MCRSLQTIVLTLITLTLASSGNAQTLSERNHARLEQHLRSLAVNLSRLDAELGRCGQSRHAHYRAEIISTVERFDIVDGAALVKFIDQESRATRNSASRCSPALARVYLERHLLGLSELDQFHWHAARED
jgi:hypothetical protein